MYLFKMLTGVSALILATSVSAAPIVWTFSDVVFDDGGTLTGSYTYDADFNTISSHNVITTAGSTLVFDTDYALATVIPYADGFDMNKHSYINILSVVTDGYINDGTGRLAYTLIGSVEVWNGGRKARCGKTTPCITRHVVSGNLTSNGVPPSVPVPAAAWLFGSGLVGLIGVARRKARA